MSKKHQIELTGLQISALSTLITAVNGSFKEDKEMPIEQRMVLDSSNVVVAMSRKELNALRVAFFKIRGW